MRTVAPEAKIEEILVPWEGFFTDLLSPTNVSFRGDGALKGGLLKVQINEKLKPTRNNIHTDVLVHPD